MGIQGEKFMGVLCVIFMTFLQVSNNLKILKNISWEIKKSKNKVATSLLFFSQSFKLLCFN